MLSKFTMHKSLFFFCTVLAATTTSTHCVFYSCQWILSIHLCVSCICVVCTPKRYSIYLHILFSLNIADAIVLRSHLLTFCPFILGACVCMIVYAIVMRAQRTKYSIIFAILWNTPNLSANMNRKSRAFQLQKYKKKSFLLHYKCWLTCLLYRLRRHTMCCTPYKFAHTHAIDPRGNRKHLTSKQTTHRPTNHLLTW